MNAEAWREHLRAILGSGERVSIEVGSIMVIEAAASNGHFEGTTNRFRVEAESHNAETFADAEEAIAYFLTLLRP